MSLASQRLPVFQRRRYFVLRPAVLCWRRALLLSFQDRRHRNGHGTFRSKAQRFVHSSTSVPSPIPRKQAHIITLFKFWAQASETLDLKWGSPANTYCHSTALATTATKSMTIIALDANFIQKLFEKRASRESSIYLRNPRTALISYCPYMEHLHTLNKIEAQSYHILPSLQARKSGPSVERVPCLVP